MTLQLERPAELQPRRFTFAEFEQMSDLGLFADQHVELLNGEILVKGLQSTEHAFVIQNLSDLFHSSFGTDAVIRTQLPIVLDTPPPDFVEPDLALLKLPKTQYKTRTATSSDVLLVVEVSDSTLERDQNLKLNAYARNGVAEYWILNVHTNQLEVYREPSESEYLSIRKYKSGQAVAPLEFPDVLLEWW
jgi:Uma2 family endonuclease